MTAPHPVVVVGYDGTDAARAAVSVAIERVRTGGRLIVLRSYDVSPEDAHGPFHGDLLEAAADDARRSLRELSDADARLAFVDWEWMAVQGDPARTLCRVAAEAEADELILGTRGLDRVGVLLGSVAADVLHLADRPVTVIPQRMLDHGGRVVPAAG